MELHSLKPAKGAVKNTKRIARGQGSGHGGTATRGHKGAKSRSGYSRKLNFEGGQTPLQMRVPKRGFKSPFRIAYTPINLDELMAYAEKFGTDKFDLDFYKKLRILRPKGRIKILGNGELSKKITVDAHAISESAKAAIEAKGGTVNLV